MKFLVFLLVFTSLFISSGCSSFYSLRRTSQRRSIPTRRQAAPQQRPAPQAASRRQQSDVDLFNTVFRRNPQDFSADSHLSTAEREALRQHDASRDPAIRELRNRANRPSGERSDWVFGTRNGSFF